MSPILTLPLLLRVQGRSKFKIIGGADYLKWTFFLIVDLQRRAAEAANLCNTHFFYKQLGSKVRAQVARPNDQI